MFRKNKGQIPKKDGLFRLGSRFSSLLFAMINSYWFFPLIIVILSISLAIGTTLFDAYIFPSLELDLRWLFATSAEGARQVLSTIAGSMITVAGVTFSLTTVAVSNAAISFGPRLVKNFMGDRSNQITLGVFTGTYLYCLIVLRSIHELSGNVGQNAYEFIPSISLLTGVLLAIASVVWLVYFIHHVPESINISNIVARVGENLESCIVEIGNNQLGRRFISDEEQNKLLKCADNVRPIRSDDSGYVQALDFGGLVEAACRYDLVVWIQAYPGKFVASGEPFAFVARNDLECSFDDSEFQDLVSIGTQRTPHQDINFLLDELLEILIKALSPGVCDPYTAQTSLDWIRVFLVRIDAIDASDRFLRDDKDQLRVICPAEDFRFFLDYICKKSLSYIVNDNNTSIYFVQTLSTLGIHVKEENQSVVVDQLISFADLLAKQENLTVHYATELIEAIGQYRKVLVQNRSATMVQTNRGLFRRLRDFPI